MGRPIDPGQPEPEGPEDPTRPIALEFALSLEMARYLGPEPAARFRREGVRRFMDLHGAAYRAKLRDG